MVVLGSPKHPTVITMTLNGLPYDKRRTRFFGRINV